MAVGELQVAEERAESDALVDVEGSRYWENAQGPRPRPQAATASANSIERNTKFLGVFGGRCPARSTVCASHTCTDTAGAGIEQGGRWAAALV